ncbi:hypothetical protein A3F66_03820 [candidate division TM6 bacterium RIFCSPHIGHO2_12_FULL_32_22]|nr:MAG: hypothetical protein A3F66_03820 [candidate division TM6 bacterium RIFCSPHIGHO2_12_FULL_32_22]
MSFYLKLTYFRIVSLFAHLNAIAKLLVTILILGTIFGFWYLNIYQENIGKIMHEQQAIFSIDNEKINLENILEKYANDPSEIKNLNNNIHKLFDEDLKTPEKIIDELLQYAHSTNLKIENFQEKTLSDKQDFCKKKLDFDLVGNFYEVLNFLETISNSCSVIKFNRFTINRLKEGSLKVSFSCSLYCPKD